MLECVNFLAARGHETHAIAEALDPASISKLAICHKVDGHTLIPALHVPRFVRASARQIAALSPQADITAGFGVAGQPGGVIWMQSVHAAWIEIAQRVRGFCGRWKQRLNPFHPVILAMERRMLKERRYRQLIALTPQVKDDLMRIYNVPASDIAVLPNGYSRSEFNVEHRARRREEMRARLGFRDEHRVVVFVANEFERKGFFPLLQAVAALGDPDVRLLAVGRLNPKACRGEIERLKMTGRVTFSGPTSDVADYYAAADLFALPTQYEAWGLVVVEALASGLPVLTSRLAGAAAVVREGVTGLLLDDPQDDREIAAKLDRLLRSPERSAVETSESVASYAWDRLLLQYEAILAANAK
jgi:UDP-glucose:(heptosyl)LPS alpha-1,3-glucosyltransferase